MAEGTAGRARNYPAEYTAALLTSVGNHEDRAAIHLADRDENGVRDLRPDVNESVAEFTTAGDDVRFGLRSVHIVGDNVVKAIDAIIPVKNASAGRGDRPF
ncbi:hypothetical protein ACFVH0_21065 [Streptomyces sp. NPDC127117]|uniref:helix-hairpin-helix domain-containing protein n=1 Tax=Streptomyces sp. NPDC127117 TaxID=3345368 RepID=UPI00362E70BE